MAGLRRLGSIFAFSGSPDTIGRLGGLLILLMLYYYMFAVLQ